MDSRLFHSAQRLGLSALIVTVLLGGTAVGLGQEVVPSDPVTKIELRPAVACPSPAEMEKRYSKPLDQIRVEKRPAVGPLPVDCSTDLFARPQPGAQARRPWTCTQFQWVAPELAYQPLYFDEVPLERYGQSACPALQPLISGAHFFAMFPLMPYKMGLEGPYEKVYTLGYYRPGSDAPCVRQRLPWDFHAALLEAGAWTGAVFLLP